MTSEEFAECSDLDNMKIANKTQRNVMLAYPTVEYPVRILLEGTDETTYSTCCETVEIAMQVVEMLDVTPTWERLHVLGFHPV